MGLSIRNVQVDVPADHYDAAVAFWAGALGAVPRPAGGPFIHLVGVAGTVGLHLQRLDAGPAGYHLDLETDDPDAEVARLRDLGASDGVGGPDGPPVLHDPAGLAFCVCRRGDGPAERLREARPDRGFLEMVVVDLPSDERAAGAAFWAAALGVEARPLPPPIDAYTHLHGGHGPDGRPADVLVQDVGGGTPARLHVDLHLTDREHREAEVARLVALGASVVAVQDRWHTLRDPAGNLFCVVPQ
ncbi:MAG TPA: VOC family protein [Egicoccus sp.]|nr:VOC family protein [Egicoccus sp.]HSK23511.1 VOC family protein [Egicoccus sp.]